MAVPASRSSILENGAPADRAYWRERLAGLEEAGRLRRSRPQGLQRGVERFGFEVDQEIVAGLERLTGGGQFLIYVTLLAALVVTLRAYTGSRRIVVGSPVRREGDDGEEPSQVLPIIADLGGVASFRDLLLAVRQSLLDAYAHQGCDVEALRRQRGSGEPAASFHDTALRLDGIHGPLPAGSAALVLDLRQGDGRLTGTAELERAELDVTTGRRFIRDFLGCLRCLCRDTGTPLESLELLDPVTEHLLRHEWNDTTPEMLETECVHRLFARRAVAIPDALAVDDGEVSWSYGELEERSSRLARRLRELGVERGARVAVLVPPSSELILALTGVLKAGGAFLPLDPTYPLERLQFQIGDAGARVLLTAGSVADPVVGEEVTVLALDADWEGMARQPPAADGQIDVGDLAYVIYTSGSTGHPKGVAVEHGPLAGLCRWTWSACGVSAGDRVAQVAGVAFDGMVWDVWPFLSRGASVVVAPEEVRISPPQMVAWLVERAVSITFLPTPVAEAALEEPWPRWPALRIMVSAGDKLHQPPRQPLPYRLLNHYGPTENCVLSTSEPVAPSPTAGAPPIGRPILRTRTYLVDGELRLVPAGGTGELLLGGRNLARGYVRRPKLTAEKFVPDPFSDEAGARLYHSGDLARHLADGRIEYLGRVDHQVQVRGFRVETGEIEAVLAQHPDIRAVAVQPFTRASGEVWLAAHVVPRPGADLDDESLRHWLGERLPQPMVPAAFITMGELPLTRNGKVDRRALPQPVMAGSERRASSVAPRTLVEEVLAGILADVLGLERVGVHESFFSLGGHSLLATQVMARVRAAFSVDLPLRSLFDHPTVDGLAVIVEEVRGAGAGVVLPSIEPVERDQPLPASFAQRRLWFLDRFELGNVRYNLPVALRLRGRLSVVALHTSIGEVIRRHEVLRTTFESAGEEVLQVIHPPAVPPLLVIDLGRLPVEARRGLAGRLRDAWAAQPFDLTTGPLLRSLLLRLSDRDHQAVCSIHHVASDGWSMGLFVQEVNELYAAFSSGRSPSLPELPVQYADFAHWQHRHRSRLAGPAQVSYWKERLAGATVLDLPADRPRGRASGSRGGSVPINVSEPLAAGVSVLARREEATSFIVLLAAMGALLHRYTGQEDVVIGSPIANRNRTETEALIGFFVNTLPLRCDLSETPTVRRLVARLRETALEAYEHQDLPFEQLVEELQPERELGRTPLFQVVFALHTTAAASLRLPGLVVEPVEVDLPAAKFDWTLSLLQRDGGLRGALEYDADLFDASTVRRVVEHYLHLLAAMLRDPAAKIGELSFLSAAERHQLQREWSGADATGPTAPESIHQQFERQVGEGPEAVAMVAGEESLTYGELAAQAGRLARRLVASGIGPESTVGLYSPHCPEAVVAILGILTSGGAYVPLDPGWPSARRRELLAAARVSLVVSQQPWSDGLPAEIPSEVLPRRLEASPYTPVTALPGRSVGSGDLAYVMFTSGSTGEPKGVAVSHGAVLRLVREADFAAMGRGEVFLQLAPLAFDASVLELWGPLLNGGRLVIFQEDRPTVAKLGRALGRYRVTTLWLTAGLFHQMVDDGLASLAGLRQLLAGGDVLSPSHVRRVVGRVSGVRLINGYGPTENTTFTCCHGIASLPEAGEGSVPIGRPITGTSVFLLDRTARPVPCGVPGELCTGGAGLARCYLGRPAWTAERFVPDAVGGGTGGRLYRTGDLARFRADGVMEFLGRIDHQVKLRGFRVEPGEIEARLTAHPAVKEAVVVAREMAGDLRLTAYYVQSPGAEIEARELRSHLQAQLPEPLVPAGFVALPALPLTANGKVDRPALPQPEGGGEEEWSPPAGPVEEVLAAIWAEVLGLEKVGRHDDFFALGGHSLMATRVVSRLTPAFGCELPVRAVFEAPRLAELAKRIVSAGKEISVVPRLEPSDRSGPVPLSFAQQRLWFLDRLHPGRSTYNIPVALRFRGRLRQRRLEACLEELVRRHEVLRTTYATFGGEARQAVGPAAVRLPLRDLVGLAPRHREEVARRLAACEASRPFDLERGPVLRATLVRLAPAEHVALFTLHHIAGDGWSIGLLVEELNVAYGAADGAAPSPLSPLPVQYADYAVWQRRTLRGDLLAAELEHWRERLDGAPVLDLPTDRPRPATPTDDGATVPVKLPPELGSGLRTLARHSGATLFMVLLAAWKVLLHRYTGQWDIAVGTVVANRTHPEVENLIGFFVNTLVLRTELGRQSSFAELLGAVRRVALDAYVHQEVPFEKLVEELQPRRDLQRSPLFQVMLVLQNAPRRSLHLDEVAVEAVPIEHATAKFDWTLTVLDGETSLEGELEYRRDLFDRTTVQRVVQHYVQLLAAASQDPTLRLPELALLSPAQRHQLLVSWGGGPVEAEGENVPGVVWRCAVARPDTVAVRSGGEHATYRDLHRRVRSLAGILGRRGVGPDRVVGLYTERSLEMVVGMLAILEAGGAYLPLNPSHPPASLGRSVQETGTRLVLAPPALHPSARELGVEVLALGRHRQPVAETPHESRLPLPGNLAYVLYTSGSTGAPKGAMVSHQALSNHMRWFLQAFGISPEDRILQKTFFGFDASVWELLAPLMAGGLLLLAEPQAYRDAAYLVEEVQRSAVTRLQAVPTLLTVFVQQEGVGGCTSLRTLFSGGEPLSTALAGRLARRTGAEVVNLYGLTEAAVDDIWGLWHPGLARRETPIGRPVTNCRVQLLAPGGEPPPIGVPGELAVGGTPLARGYAGRPALTSGRFVPDPLSETPGGRLYRSGDLARFLPDGQLELLGRIDRQVKLLGVRVELGGVEAVLSTHPGVEQAAVAVGTSRSGEPQLMAWVTAASQPRPTPSGLREFLRSRLPQVMVPPVLLVLDELPRTASGKIDYRALPQPERDGEEGWSPPAGPVEEVLAAIWAEVLGVERVGRHDDFFELGGHSLMATRVAARAEESFGVALAVRALFEATTLAALARVVEERVRGDHRTLPPIVPRRSTDPIPPSFAQERLWFLDRLGGLGAAYHIPLALELSGPLIPRALAASVGEVLRRHESLRTVFRDDRGEPMQVVQPSAPVALPVIDLQRLSPACRSELALELAREEACRRFDLAGELPLRVRLLRLGTVEHRLLTTVHHIAADGWSLGILSREMGILYESYSQGRPSPLEPPAIQYADYAVWQRRWLSSEVLESRLEAWRRRLAGLPPVFELPTDRLRTARRSVAGGTESLRLSTGLGEALRSLSRQRRVSLFMTLLAVWQGLLARVSGTPDFAIGTPTAGRTRVETEGVIGFFLNNLTLRADLSGDPPFTTLLERVRETVLDAFTDQDLPFERLVEVLCPDRNLAVTPLFQVFFQLLNLPEQQIPAGELRLTSLPLAGSPDAKFDLSFSWSEQEDGGLDGTLLYSRALWDATSMQRLLAAFGRIAEAVVTHPERRFSQLPLLGPAEAQQLREWGAGAPGRKSELCLHDLVCDQAARTLAAAALVTPEETLSYGELVARAELLARRLHRWGAGPERVVALCGERSSGMVVAILAVLVAGSAYCVLDPGHPRERLRVLLSELTPAMVLAQPATAAGLPSGPWEVHPLAEPGPGEGEPVAFPATSPDNLAYLAFTSGSSGRPKAVLVPHRGVVSYLRGYLAAYWAPAAGETALQLASFSFDASVRDLVGPLSTGARVVLLTEAEAANPAVILDRILQHGVTWIPAVVPTFLSILVDAASTGPAPASLRLLLVSGEPLQAALARAVREVFGPVRMVNQYGPTESTLTAACLPLDPERPASGPVWDARDTAILGRAIPGRRLRILDRNGNAVPPGAWGEIYLGGEGLTRGYLGAPARTSERFVPDPEGDPLGGRLYRTGDLARYRPDGALELVGRLDHQLKLRGIRVEPAEIESAIEEHPGVQRSVVVLRADRGRGPRLVAYYLSSREEGPTGEGLHGFLASRLPPHLVPAVFVELAAFPRTATGKLDRKALPLPEKRAAGAGPEESPRDHIETVLVRIWEDLLERSVGLRSSFFTLGGHSLLGVRLMGRIHEELGVRLPLSALFQHPTVEALGNLVRRGGGSAPGSCLVSLKRGGGHPWFWVHGMGGNVHVYVPLARRFRGPFYSFQAPGVDGSDRPLGTIEALAARHLAELRAVQPGGPYRLGGWSMGGIIAFEMARRLVAEGEEVERLALIDTRAPSPREGQIVDDNGEESDRKGLIAAFARHWGLTADTPEVRRQMRPLFRLFLAHYRARVRYRPDVYPGDLLLLRAADSPHVTAGPNLGWEVWAGGELEVVTVPGDHYSVLEEPGVHEVALACQDGSGYPPRSAETGSTQAARRAGR